MAKSKSKPVFNISGTVLGITFVNSTAYGKHIRAARGTYTPVEVNEAFKATSKQLISANLPAKMIKDAIDPYRIDFVHGMLWQRLVSIFRKQYKENGAFDFKALKDFEIHSEFPLTRLVTFQSTVSFDFLQSQIMVTLDFENHPDFKESGVDGYRVTGIAIHPDLRHKTAATYQIVLPVINLKDKVKPLTIAIPQHSDLTLLCVKLEACSKGEVVNNYATKGMKIMQVIEPG